MLLILFLLINVKSVFATEKFFLSADTISKNENNNTIKAEGNVSITNNQYKLKANEMVYNRGNSSKGPGLGAEKELGVCTGQNWYWESAHRSFVLFVPG